MRTEGLVSSPSSLQVWLMKEQGSTSPESQGVMHLFLPSLGPFCRGNKRVIYARITTYSFGISFLWELNLSSKIFNYGVYSFDFWPLYLPETMPTSQSKLSVGCKQSKHLKQLMPLCFIVEVAITYRINICADSSINSHF